MRTGFYLLLLFLLLIFPVSGQKNTQSLRDACRTECARKNNVCLQESQGDGPKKEACERQFRACLYQCSHPQRRG